MCDKDKLSVSFRNSLVVYLMQQFAILPEVDHYVFDLSTIDMLPNMTEVGARIAFERNNVNFSLRSSVQLSNILTQVDTEASVSFNISNYRLGVGATVLYNHWDALFGTPDSYRVGVNLNLQRHGRRLDVESRMSAERAVGIGDRDWTRTNFRVVYLNDSTQPTVEEEIGDALRPNPELTVIVRHFRDIVLSQPNFENTLAQINIEAGLRDDMSAFEYKFLFVTAMAEFASGLYDHDAMHDLKDDLNLASFRLRNLSHTDSQNFYRIVREALGGSDFITFNVDPSGNATGVNIRGNARGRYVCNNMADFESAVLVGLGIPNVILRTYSHAVVFVRPTNSYRGRIIDGSGQVIG